MMEFNRSLSQYSDGAKKRVEKTTLSSNQSAPDYIQLSHGPTPENPGLYGGMKPSDRARTSDGSRSQHDGQMG
jgi:hypothetical protein